MTTYLQTIFKIMVPEKNITSLDQLDNNKEAKVCSVSEFCPNRLRFLELGFTNGASVKILRRAFLGDPLMVMVRNSRFAIRKSDAKLISVTLL